MVMRRDGSAKPVAGSAARTRARAAATAWAGSPTPWKAGSPGATCTWTVTLRASMPSNATVVTRWTMPNPDTSRTQIRRSRNLAHEHLQNKAARPRRGGGVGRTCGLGSRLFGHRRLDLIGEEFFRLVGGLQLAVLVHHVDPPRAFFAADSVVPGDDVEGL